MNENVLPQSYGDPSMLEESGVLPTGDAKRQGTLRNLAWRMVETADLPNGRRQTILSRDWVAAQGLSVALFLGLNHAEEVGLHTMLGRHGHAELLGTPVDVKLAASPPSFVWSIPNDPDEEGVPVGNFLLAHSGLATLVFSEAVAFGLHTDEEGEVRILAAPPDVIRAVTRGAPGEANRLFRRRAEEMEGSGSRFRAGALTVLMDQYGPYLLGDT